MCRPLALRRGIRIFDHTVSDQGHIRADRQRFKQVLVNLLANAVKYNRDGGEIHVTLTSERVGTFRVSVIDTGIGVATEDLSRLFQPFERLSADGTGVEGTGLGLALTKKLMIAMDGEVGVSSRVGEGSTFWVELPIAESPANGGQGESTRHQAALATVSGPSVTVLYIEDNLTNVRLLEQVMRLRPNVDLMVAMQGRIGLQMALDHRPGIILLDLHLPDMSGNEVLRSIRADERTAATPVVILSADATSGQSGQPNPAGATAFLSKPFDIARLLQLVDDLGGSPDMPTRGEVVLPVPNPIIAADLVTTDDVPDDDSDSAIEEFAHELINMLGVIVTYCDLMTHAASDPATVSYLARAGAAAGLAVDLTRDFVLAHSVGEPVGIGSVAERGAPV
jgi:CheY-like chemotaxis protein/anti-sigma regulatory factor (Ser/Thr protein kinase)